MSDKMHGWAETSRDTDETCDECFAPIPAGQRFFYVTEREDNVPICWRHVEGEVDPK